LIGQFTPDTLPLETWIQASLTLNNGGLGLKSSFATAHIAYVASLIDCSVEIERSFPGFMSVALPCVDSLQRSISYISERSGIDGFDVNHVLRMRQDNVFEDGKFVNLQCKLTTMVEKHVTHVFHERLSNRKLAWSLSCADQCASTFLTAIPKCPTFTFSSDEMRVLLCHRLFLPQPDRSEGMRCICKTGRGAEHPVVDNLAHHCITGCSKRRFGGDIHDSVVYSLSQCFSMLGYGTKREPKGLFGNAIGDFSEEERNKRPDLFIRDIVFPNQRGCSVDVSLTSPVPLSETAPFTRDEASVINRAASFRFTEKVNKYEKISNACGIKFQPFIIETTGRLHSSSMSWLKKAFKNRDGGDRDNTLLFQHWLHKIGCSFHKQLATNILETFKVQRGTRLATLNFENRHEFVFQSANNLQGNSL
jgi:hypothetical protein